MSNQPNSILHDEQEEDAFEQSLANQEAEDLERQIAEAEEYREQDQFLSDAEADGDALASCGMGTDEDYGCYGGDE